MITRLGNLVQLSIYSTRASFHKYVVAMKYRQMCKCFILSKSPSLNEFYIHLPDLVFRQSVSI